MPLATSGWHRYCTADGTAEIFCFHGNGNGSIGTSFVGRCSQVQDPAGKTCPKGALINTLIETSKFSLLNDGTHTCLTTREKRNTTVDLTLATTGVAIKANWTVDEQEFGSIHLAILIEIGSDIPIVKKTTKRINQEKAATLINEIKPQYLYDPEEMQNVFDESIGKATYVVKDKKGNWLK